MFQLTITLVVESDESFELSNRFEGFSEGIAH